MAQFDPQFPDVGLENQQTYQPPSPSHDSHNNTSGQPEPDMPVPNPLPFLGVANDLPHFKLKLTHYLWGHQTSYPTPQRRLLYSASLLLGAAEQWLITHVDPFYQSVRQHLSRCAMLKKHITHLKEHSR